MVNLKTKFDKHANDNEKRRRSIREKEKAKSNQSQIIKQALSNSSLSNSSSKKIIFKDDDDDDGTEIVSTNSNGKSFNENGKTTLFDDSDGEEEGFEIKEKSQFSGKKGFELLNLQSTYGNDERFRIDERFLEEDKEEFNEDSNKTQEDEHTSGERVKQLKILESVLGTSIAGPDSEKKPKKRTKEMVRYDASNKDHKIYEINKQVDSGKPTPSKKRKEGRKSLKIDKPETSTPKVSKEKFYEVSNEIKNRFKEKTEEGGQFSLLQTYGVNGGEENDKEEEEEEEEEEEIEYGDAEESISEINRNDRSSQFKMVDEPKIETKSVLAKGIWKESFFFDEDDPRFKDGLEFINKKNSEEAKEAAENYDKTRKKLKEILRLHLKKQMHKKDPFRHKIGGMNKKQLGGLRSKNPRMTSGRRKPPRMNPGGRS